MGVRQTVTLEDLEYTLEGNIIDMDLMRMLNAAVTFFNHYPGQSIRFTMHPYNSPYVLTIFRPKFFSCVVEVPSDIMKKVRSYETDSPGRS
jgi:hypothetical protein